MVPIYLYHLLFYLPIAIIYKYIISRRKENGYPLTMRDTVSWETPTLVKKKNTISFTGTTIVHNLLRMNSKNNLYIQL